MKLVIAGTRTFDHLDRWDIENFLHIFHLTPTEIVEGGGGGVDKAAGEYAKHQGASKGMKHIRFDADWNKHGRAAGPIRNKQMAEYGDALLIIWDGESRGSFNMKQEMMSMSKNVYEIIIRTYGPDHDEAA